LFAHLNKIATPERVHTRDLNYFFSSGAKEAILWAQRNKTSLAVPANLHYYAQQWKDALAAWISALQDWNKIFPTRQDVGFPDPLQVAQAEAAERERKRKQKEIADREAAAARPTKLTPVKSAVIGDELRISRMVDAAIKQLQAQDPRVTHSISLDLCYASRPLAEAILQTEKTIGVVVDEKTLFPIIEEHRRFCSEDFDALHTFGSTLCKILGDKLYEKMKP
jgi:hypothetical protein